MKKDDLVGLPKELRSLLMMNSVSLIIFIYIGIFVNLYVWEMGRQISDVAWFNLILLMAWGCSFAAGAYILTRSSIRLLYGLSAVSGCLAFLLLSFLNIDNRLLWIAIIGVPVGAMWGFSIAAQNLSISLHGKGKDFGHYFSLSLTIAQVLNMIVPIASALVIKSFGYTGSFIFMLALVSVMLIVSFFLPEISLKSLMDNRQPERSSLVWRTIFSRREAKWLIPACLAAGIFLQFQNFFVLMFTFSISKDKIVISLLNTLYTCTSVAAFYLYRKLNIKEHIWLTVAIGFLGVGFLLVLYPISPVLVVSNILTTVGLFYFSSTWNAGHFRMISGLPVSQKVGILVLRECLLAISRCIMLVFVLSVQDFHGTVFVGLVLFSLICMMLIPYFQAKLVGNPESYENDDELNLLYRKESKGI